MAREHERVAGQMLRTARRHADLSQRQLAERAGVATSTVGRIESGQVGATVDVLVTLLRSCGCTLALADDAGARIPLIRDGPRDRAGRRLPAHLDAREVVAFGDWWHDRWCTHATCEAPAWTFCRSRWRRDQERAKPACDPAADRSFWGVVTRAGASRWRLAIPPSAARMLVSAGVAEVILTFDAGDVRVGLTREGRRWFVAGEIPGDWAHQRLVVRPRRGDARAAGSAY